MQIDVPHSVFGYCRYSVPTVIGHWLKDQNLSYSHCGQSYEGALENGVSHYIVENAKNEDAAVFKLRFPDCRVHHFTIE